MTTCLDSNLLYCVEVPMEKVACGDFLGRAAVGRGFFFKV